ncbi:phage tail tape measure protein [Methylobacter tundripaludum]|uniref:Phage tail tape measure protein, TP901 family n=1 Tax=Methylobacter tundripaludum (strain ATCC BAA-1195 / DSM 17260 / SV96) TaxID=697282 RepID=G3IRG2_METTV|nr:phage tail tape measure protein [Methylobacter tundripaludum]EGW22173.1 phage tail tape measure protein, TP901 family [Methylobacter tundripaludum SV96]
MANNIALGIVIGASLSSTVGRAFQSLDARATGLGRSLQNVHMGRNAADDVIRYRTRLDNLIATQHQFGASNTNLWGQIARTEASLRTASQRAERYGLNIGDIVNENRRLLQSEQSVSRQLERTNRLRANRDRRSELGGQMIGTVGMSYAAAAPIKDAIEFESVMADVRKVVDVSDAEFKGLGKSILDMSATMPMAASGIGAIVSAAGQSGVAKEELLGFTTAAVKMGVAFDMTGEEAGQTMASWRAGMAINQKQAESLADAVNYLDSNMNASAKNISEVVTRQGAVAKAAGLTEIQIAALSASLLNSGAAPEIAATALKNLTNALTKGGSATKDQVEVFKQLGMTSEEVTTSMQKDAEGTIKKVFAELAKAPAENRGALVGDLFGEEAKGAIMPLLVNIKALDQAFNSVADASSYAGSMQKEYDIRSQTTANNLTLLGNKATRLGVNLGTVLLPTLNTVFGAMGDGINVVTGLSEKFPAVTAVIVGAAVGLVGLKVVALATGYAATILSDGWIIARGVMDFFRLSTLRSNAALVWQKAVMLGATIQQKAMAVWTGTVTTAQWLWNAALSANPIGLVVAGVALLGAAAYLIYDNWKPITAWFGGVFTAIGGVVTTVGSAIGAAFFTAASSVRAVWEPVMSWLAEKFAWIGQSVEWVKGIGSSIGGAVSSAAKGPVLGAAMAATVAAPAMATPLPTMPPAAGSAGQGAVTQTTHAPITIVQQPGEDSNALAERVAKHLKKQQAADARGALHD